MADYPEWEREKRQYSEGPNDVCDGCGHTHAECGCDIEFGERCQWCQEFAVGYDEGFPTCAACYVKVSP